MYNNNSFFARFLCHFSQCRYSDIMPNFILFKTCLLVSIPAIFTKPADMESVNAERRWSDPRLDLGPYRYSPMPNDFGYKPAIPGNLANNYRLTTKKYRVKPRAIVTTPAWREGDKPQGQKEIQAKKEKLLEEIIDLLKQIAKSKDIVKGHREHFEDKMARRSLRQKPRISYYEPEEPGFDEYLFCEECSDYVFEYCAIHGPLLVIPDDKVPPKPKYPPVVPRAALTIPNVFLHLAPSFIPGAGIGVFSTLTVPQGVRFGPYRGLRADEVRSMYCWQIYDRNNKRSHVVDAADAQQSNWMRYVNCARHWTEQNLVAYQYKGELYYRTIKIIPRFTELLVFYGSEFANLLNINVSKYNSPEHYSEVLCSYKVAVQKINSPVNNIEESVQESSNLQIEDNTQDNEELLNFNDYKVIDENIDKTQTVSIADSLDENTITLNFTATQENKTITNDSKFQCSKCEKSYSHKKSLKAHNQIHTGQIYKCSECSYTTSIAYSLKRHIIRHVKRKKITCEYSPFQTELQQKYIKHSVENTNTELNKLNTASYYSKIKYCNLCDFKTYSRKSFQTHRLKHQGVVYKCELCDYSNYSKINYANHFIRKHGK